MQGEEEQLILDSAVESLYEKESEITFEDRVESLLHTVKKVNIRDSLKMTILHHICIQCDQFKTEMHFIDTLKVLLFTGGTYEEEAGNSIKLNVEDMWGKTALHFLASRKKTSKIYSLLNLISELGREEALLVNTQDKSKRTFLHLLIYAGEGLFVKQLLLQFKIKYKFDLKLEDSQGNSIKWLLHTQNPIVEHISFCLSAKAKDKEKAVLIWNNLTTLLQEDKLKLKYKYLCKEPLYLSVLHQAVMCNKLLEFKNLLRLIREKVGEEDKHKLFNIKERAQGFTILNYICHHGSLPFIESILQFHKESYKLNFRTLSNMKNSCLHGIISNRKLNLREKRGLFEPIIEHCTQMCECVNRNGYSPLTLWIANFNTIVMVQNPQLLMEGIQKIVPYANFSNFIGDKLKENNMKYLTEKWERHNHYRIVSGCQREKLTYKEKMCKKYRENHDSNYKVERKKRIKKRGINEISSLEAGIRQNNTELVEYLIKNTGTDTNIFTSDGCHILYLALNNGNSQILTLLLSKKQIPRLIELENGGYFSLDGFFMEAIYGLSIIEQGYKDMNHACDGKLWNEELITMIKEYNESGSIFSGPTKLNALQFPNASIEEYDQKWGFTSHITTECVDLLLQYLKEFPLIQYSNLSIFKTFISKPQSPTYHNSPGEVDIFSNLFKTSSVKEGGLLTFGELFPSMSYALWIQNYKYYLQILSEINDLDADIVSDLHKYYIIWAITRGTDIENMLRNYESAFPTIYKEKLQSVISDSTEMENILNHLIYISRDPVKSLEYLTTIGGFKLSTTSIEKIWMGKYRISGPLNIPFAVFTNLNRAVLNNVLFIFQYIMNICLKEPTPLHYQIIGFLLKTTSSFKPIPPFTGSPELSLMIFQILLLEAYKKKELGKLFGYLINEKDGEYVEEILSHIVSRGLSMNINQFIEELISEIDAQIPVPQLEEEEKAIFELMLSVLDREEEKNWELEGAYQSDLWGKAKEYYNISNKYKEKTKISSTNIYFRQKKMHYDSLGANLEYLLGASWEKEEVEKWLMRIIKESKIGRFVLTRSHKGVTLLSEACRRGKVNIIDCILENTHTLILTADSQSPFILTLTSASLDQETKIQISSKLLKFIHKIPENTRGLLFKLYEKRMRESKSKTENIFSNMPTSKREERKFQEIVGMCISMKDLLPIYNNPPRSIPLAFLFDYQDGYFLDRAASLRGNLKEMERPMKYLNINSSSPSDSPRMQIIEWIREYELPGEIVSISPALREGYNMNLGLHQPLHRPTGSKYQKDKSIPNTLPSGMGRGYVTSPILSIAICNHVITGEEFVQLCSGLDHLMDVEKIYLYRDLLYERSDPLFPHSQCVRTLILRLTKQLFSTILPNYLATPPPTPNLLFHRWTNNPKLMLLPAAERLVNFAYLDDDMDCVRNILDLCQVNQTVLFRVIRSLLRWSSAKYYLLTMQIAWNKSEQLVEEIERKFKGLVKTLCMKYKYLGPDIRTLLRDPRDSITELTCYQFIKQNLNQDIGKLFLKELLVEGDQKLFDNLSPNKILTQLWILGDLDLFLSYKEKLTKLDSTEVHLLMENITTIMGDENIKIEMKIPFHHLVQLFDKYLESASDKCVQDVFWKGIAKFPGITGAQVQNILDKKIKIIWNGTEIISSIMYSQHRKINLDVFKAFLDHSPITIDNFLYEIQKNNLFRKYNIENYYHPAMLKYYGKTSDKNCSPLLHILICKLLNEGFPEGEEKRIIEFKEFIRAIVYRLIREDNVEDLEELLNKFSSKGEELLGGSEETFCSSLKNPKLLWLRNPFAIGIHYSSIKCLKYILNTYPQFLHKTLDVWNQNVDQYSVSSEVKSVIDLQKVKGLVKEGILKTQRIDLVSIAILKGKLECMEFIISCLIGNRSEGEISLYENIITGMHIQLGIVSGNKGVFNRLIELSKQEVSYEDLLLAGEMNSEEIALIICDSLWHQHGIDEEKLSRTINGNTLLHSIAKYGQLKLAEMLFTEGYEMKNILMIKNTEGLTPFSQAMTVNNWALGIHYTPPSFDFTAAEITLLLNTANPLSIYLQITNGYKVPDFILNTKLTFYPQIEKYLCYQGKPMNKRQIKGPIRNRFSELILDSLTNGRLTDLFLLFTLRPDIRQIVLADTKLLAMMKTNLFIALKGRHFMMAQFFIHILKPLFVEDDIELIMNKAISFLNDELILFIIEELGFLERSSLSKWTGVDMDMKFKAPLTYFTKLGYFHTTLFEENILQRSMPIQGEYTVKFDRPLTSWITKLFETGTLYTFGIMLKFIKESAQEYYNTVKNELFSTLAVENFIVSHPAEIDFLIQECPDVFKFCIDFDNSKMYFNNNLEIPIFEFYKPEKMISKLIILLLTRGKEIFSSKDDSHSMTDEELIEKGLTFMFSTLIGLIPQQIKVPQQIDLLDFHRSIIMTGKIMHLCHELENTPSQLIKVLGTGEEMRTSYLFSNTKILEIILQKLNIKNLYFMDGTDRMINLSLEWADILRLIQEKTDKQSYFQPIEKLAEILNLILFESIKFDDLSIFTEEKKGPLVVAQFNPKTEMNMEGRGIKLCKIEEFDNIPDNWREIYKKHLGKKRMNSHIKADEIKCLLATISLDLDKLDEKSKEVGEGEYSENDLFFLEMNIEHLKQKAEEISGTVYQLGDRSFSLALEIEKLSRKSLIPTLISVLGSHNISLYEMLISSIRREMSKLMDELKELHMVDKRYHSDYPSYGVLTCNVLREPNLRRLITERRALADIERGIQLLRTQSGVLRTSSTVEEGKSYLPQNISIGEFQQLKLKNMVVQLQFMDESQSAALNLLVNDYLDDSINICESEYTALAHDYTGNITPKFSCILHPYNRPRLKTHLHPWYSALRLRSSEKLFLERILENTQFDSFPFVTFDRRSLAYLIGKPIVFAKQEGNYSYILGVEEYLENSLIFAKIVRNSLSNIRQFKHLAENIKGVYIEIVKAEEPLNPPFFSTSELIKLPFHFVDRAITITQISYSLVSKICVITLHAFENIPYLLQETNINNIKSEYKGYDIKRQTELMQKMIQKYIDFLCSPVKFWDSLFSDEQIFEELIGRYDLEPELLGVSESISERIGKRISVQLDWTSLYECYKRQFPQNALMDVTDIAAYYELREEFFRSISLLKCRLTTESISSLISHNLDSTIIDKIFSLFFGSTGRLKLDFTTLKENDCQIGRFSMIQKGAITNANLSSDLDELIGWKSTEGHIQSFNSIKSQVTHQHFVLIHTHEITNFMDSTNRFLIKVQEGLYDVDNYLYVKYIEFDPEDNLLYFEKISSSEIKGYKLSDIKLAFLKLNDNNRVLLGSLTAIQFITDSSGQLYLMKNERLKDEDKEVLDLLPSLFMLKFKNQKEELTPEDFREETHDIRYFYFQKAETEHLLPTRLDLSKYLSFNLLLYENFTFRKGISKFQEDYLGMLDKLNIREVYEGGKTEKKKKADGVPLVEFEFGPLAVYSKSVSLINISLTINESLEMITDSISNIVNRRKIRQSTNLASSIPYNFRSSTRYLPEQRLMVLIARSLRVIRVKFVNVEEVERKELFGTPSPGVMEISIPVQMHDQISVRILDSFPQFWIEDYFVKFLYYAEISRMEEIEGEFRERGEYLREVRRGELEDYKWGDVWTSYYLMNKEYRSGEEAALKVIIEPSLSPLPEELVFLASLSILLENIYMSLKSLEAMTKDPRRIEKVVVQIVQGNYSSKEYFTPEVHSNTFHLTILTHSASPTSIPTDINILKSCIKHLQAEKLLFGGNLQLLKTLACTMVAGNIPSFQLLYDLDAKTMEGGGIQHDLSLDVMLYNLHKTEPVLLDTLIDQGAHVLGLLIPFYHNISNNQYIEFGVAPTLQDNSILKFTLPKTGIYPGVYRMLLTIGNAIIFNRIICFYHNAKYPKIFQGLFQDPLSLSHSETSLKFLVPLEGKYSIANIIKEIPSVINIGVFNNLEFQVLADISIALINTDILNDRNELTDKSLFLEGKPVVYESYRLTADLIMVKIKGAMKVKNLGIICKSNKTGHILRIIQPGNPNLTNSPQMQEIMKNTIITTGEKSKSIKSIFQQKRFSYLQFIGLGVYREEGEKPTQPKIEDVKEEEVKLMEIKETQYTHLKSIKHMYICEYYYGEDRQKSIDKGVIDAYYDPIEVTKRLNDKSFKKYQKYLKELKQFTEITENISPLKLFDRMEREKQIFRCSFGADYSLKDLIKKRSMELYELKQCVNIRDIYSVGEISSRAGEERNEYMELQSEDVALDQLVFVHSRIAQIQILPEVTRMSKTKIKLTWKPEIHGRYNLYLNEYHLDIDYHTFYVQNSRNISPEECVVKNPELFQNMKLGEFQKIIIVLKDIFGNTVSSSDIDLNKLAFTERALIFEDKTALKVILKDKETGSDTESFSINFSNEKNGQIGIKFTFLPDIVGRIYYVQFMLNEKPLDKNIEFKVQGMSFEKKCNSLFKNMPKIKGQSDILISRFDFLPSLAQHIKLDVFKSKIHVKFKGEPGEDAGGVSREFFELLIRELKEHKYLIEKGDSCIISRNFKELLFWKDLYTKLGACLAYIIAGKQQVDFQFSMAIYKYVFLDTMVNFSDMKIDDKEYFDSLAKLTEMNDNELAELKLNFTVTENEKEIEIIENGGSILVNKDNVLEYVNKVADWKLRVSVKEPLECIRKGFNAIIPIKMVEIFECEEINTLVGGLKEISFEFLKSKATFRCPGRIEIWFLKYIQEADQETIKALLKFTTGCSRVPHKGKWSIHIQTADGTDKLPSSSTCANTINIPTYPSYEIMKRKMDKAIEYGSEYFGFY